MTKIKFCGLMSENDIAYANEIRPEYIGFVFASFSRRCIDKEHASHLKSLLDDDIKAVGVFVDEDIETIAEYLSEGIIDIAQLHGSEDDEYIKKLKDMTGKPVIKAFKIGSLDDIDKAVKSKADHILLDAGSGDGRVFDWSYLKDIKRDYFLAGGLDETNAAQAVMLEPYGVDVSSGIETDGKKDKEKMKAFAANIRNGRKTDV